MSTTCKTKHLIGENRVPDWFECLVELIAANETTPFKWGTFDCSQFCIQAEIAMYNETRWDDLIGGYKTRKGALGRIHRAGGESLWHLIDQRMERLSSVKMAQRGDWVGHMTDDGESLGIVIDHRFVCADFIYGLNFHPMSDAHIVWRG